MTILRQHILVVFLTVLPVASSVAQSTAPVHPLDPLSADESVARDRSSPS